MGIPFDEAIKTLEHYNHGFCENSGGLSEPIKMAINIMRKYQKIEQIVSDFRKYQKGITWGFGGEKYMQMVSEVVEDGSN